MSLERVSLDGWMPPWVRYQHVTRYRWVASRVRALSVVDAACGSGYGSALMAREGAASVRAFDISSEAISKAQEAYSYPHLSFAQADVLSLPMPDGSQDLFVSLETIEHIHDDAAFVTEVARILKSGGRFICSTPNREVTNPGTSLHSKPFNQFHVREYCQEELRDLLSRHFSDISFLGQTHYAGWYVGMLSVVGRLSPWLAVKAHQLRKVLGASFSRESAHYPIEMKRGYKPEYFVVMCTK